MYYGLRTCKLKDGGNIDLNRTMHNWLGGHFIIISLLALIFVFYSPTDRTQQISEIELSWWLSG